MLRIEVNETGIVIPIKKVESTGLYIRPELNRSYIQEAVTIRLKECQKQLLEHLNEGCCNDGYAIYYGSGHYSFQAAEAMQRIVKDGELNPNNGMEVIQAIKAIAEMPSTPTKEEQLGVLIEILAFDVPRIRE